MDLERLKRGAASGDREARAELRRALFRQGDPNEYLRWAAGHDLLHARELVHAAYHHPEQRKQLRWRVAGDPTDRELLDYNGHDMVSGMLLDARYAVLGDVTVRLCWGLQELVRFMDVVAPHAEGNPTWAAYLAVNDLRVVGTVLSSRACAAHSQGRPMATKREILLDILTDIKEP